MKKVEQRKGGKKKKSGRKEEKKAKTAKKDRKSDEPVFDGDFFLGDFRDFWVVRYGKGGPTWRTVSGWGGTGWGQ